MSDRDRSMKILALSLASVALVVAGFCLWMQFSVPHASVAIVRVDEVLAKYQGAMDARSSFVKTTGSWQSNIDTLKHELHQMMMDYEHDRSSMSESVRQTMEEAIRRKQAEVEDYSRAIEERAGKEQALLTESVVNHIHRAADQLGRNRGYGLVLAVQDDATVLYKQDAVDITNEVLQVLGQNYRGELRTTK
ncbi:MAG: OmpH family outer membrane protein [Bacteroidetes bacterium]|nr:OmpH family outer membrane protein [Bacteroidota bacterium]